MKLFWPAQAKHRDRDASALRVAIAGGGIGRMALALSLHAAGFDARVLARELALQPSIQQAIAVYDAKRRLETTGVVLSNRQGGPERCLDIIDQRAPHGFVDLDAVVTRQELEQIAQSYKRTAGFDPESLNNRPSLAVRHASRRTNRMHMAATEMSAVYPYPLTDTQRRSR